MLFDKAGFSGSSQSILQVDINTFTGKQLMKAEQTGSCVFTFGAKCTQWWRKDSLLVDVELVITTVICSLGV